MKQANSAHRSRWPILALGLLLTVAAPVAAQEEAEAPKKEQEQEQEEEAAAKAEEPAVEAPEEKETDNIGSFTIEVEDWVSQPVGLQYTPATLTEASDPLATRSLTVNHGTNGHMRYRGTWSVPRNIGDLVVTYYSNEHEDPLQDQRPGQFVFGEAQIESPYAGFDNDGLADGFTSTTETRIRDLRLEFRRPAYRSARLAIDWYVGWRRMSHTRDMSTTYYTIVDDLPPFLPPLCDGPGQQGCGSLAVLDPLPDVALSHSRFEGRGASLGVDLDFPVWRDKLLFEGGINFSALRGETDARYQATNYAYTLTTGAQVIVIDADSQFISSPPPPPAMLGQLPISYGLDTEGISTNSQVLETYLGFRWRAWKRLDVVAGFREVNYTDVGLELRARGGSSFTLGTNGDGIGSLDEVTQVHHDVGYEGIYAGVSFRLR